MLKYRVHRVRFFEYQPQAIQCLAYNTVTQRLAFSREDGAIEVWNTKEKWFQENVLFAPVRDSTGSLTWLGDRLFGGSFNAEVIEYNVQLLKKERSAASNAGPVWCLSANPITSRVAAGTEDGCVVLFDISNDSLTYEKALDKQDGRILTLSWHSSGEFIATGGADNIRMWSVKSGHAILRLTVPRHNRNKETIVWSVVLLDDMTIVSGDSQGKTNFWNGKHGTLTKSFKSHKADVLTVCADHTGETIVSGGIDPQLVQFRLTIGQEGVKEWVPSRTHSYHTHDIRSIVFVHNYVVSGGVDTTLIVCKMADHLTREVVKYPPIPHLTPISYAHTGRVLLLRYNRHLELWRLGSSAHISEKNGEILPLTSQPMKLLCLNAKSDLCIICSTIADNASLLAYSDQSTVRLYKLDLDMVTDPPTIAISKIKFVEPMSPACCLKFTKCSNLLLTLSNNGNLSLSKITDDTAEVVHILKPPKDYSGSPRLLALSPDDKFVATADLDHNVQLYTIDDQCLLKHHGNLPKYTCIATSMCFSPDSSQILVSYSDRKVLEYSVAKMVFTKWTKHYLDCYHSDWLTIPRVISHVTYCKLNPNLFIIQDAESFTVINKSEPFPDQDVKGSLRKHNIIGDNCFHMCEEFKYIFFVDFLEDDWLLIVERPPMAITRALPPAFRQKKFGT